MSDPWFGNCQSSMPGRKPEIHRVGKPAGRDGGEQRREVARGDGHAGGVDRDHWHALEPAGRLVVVERAGHGAVRDHGGNPQRHQRVGVAAAVFDRDEWAGRGHERPEVAGRDRSGGDAERPVRAEGAARDVQPKAVERIARPRDGHRAARGADRLLHRQRRLAEGEATGDRRRRFGRRGTSPSSRIGATTSGHVAGAVDERRCRQGEARRPGVRRPGASATTPRSGPDRQGAPGGR